MNRKMDYSSFHIVAGYNEKGALVKEYKNRFTRILGAPFFLIPTSSHEKWQVRLGDTFDHYSPQYQWRHDISEIIDWFKLNGFEDIRELPIPNSVIGKKTRQ